MFFFFFSSRRRHTRWNCDWSSDVCSSDLIDVGTSGTRAVILDEHGAVLASGTEEHANFASPQPGWAEQDTCDWWRAATLAVRKALQASSLAAESIAAVGFSGQMHGAVLLDENDEVIRPALIWCDQRTEA